MHIIDNQLIAEAHEILGNKLSSLIERYLEDTQDTLATIDLLRSAQNLNDVIGYVHNLKSSSHYVGAVQVAATAKMIECFLIDNKTNIDNLANQTRLNHMIESLRVHFLVYEDSIKIYLSKKMLGN
jgi:HPt (histidine-containing phosphotransfer) domain-containing protein